MKKLKMIDLFSGGGMASYAAEKLVGGYETIQFCEIESYCQKVLKKHWPTIPIHDDIRTYKPEPYSADVIFGGFPCQDISTAGRGKGITKETRSGLFYELMRVIRMVRPKYVILENVAAILNNGLGIVLGELSEAGYDAEWAVISASSLGACHQRSRWWLVAYPNNYGSFASEKSRSLEKTNGRTEKRENQAINIEGSGEPKHSKTIQLHATDSNCDGHQGKCTETRNKITSRQDSQIIGSTNTSELKRCNNDRKDKGESRIDENLSRSSDGRKAISTETGRICELSETTNNDQRVSSQDNYQKNNDRALVQKGQSRVQFSEHRELARDKTISENNTIRHGNDNIKIKGMDNKKSNVANTDSFRYGGGSSEGCSIQERQLLQKKQTGSKMGSKIERRGINNHRWRNTKHRLDPNWRGFGVEPAICGDPDGPTSELLTNRANRLHLLGNGLVPQCAAIPLQRVLDLEAEVV